MTGSVGKHATESTQPCLKGRNRVRMSALEEAKGEYRFSIQNRGLVKEGYFATRRSTPAGSTWSLLTVRSLLTGAGAERRPVWQGAEGAKPVGPCKWCLTPEV